MLEIEDFLEKASHSNVIVLAVGADAKLRADAEIPGEDDTRYVGH